MFFYLFFIDNHLKYILNNCNMRDIVLLNCPEIECPKVLIYVFIELCQAFIERNYNFKIIQNKILTDEVMKESKKNCT